MKKTLRIISLMLALVMMVSLLAACGGEKNPVETQKPATSDKTPATQAPSGGDKPATQAPAPGGNTPATQAPTPGGNTPATQAPVVTDTPAVDKWKDVNFGGAEVVMNLNNWEFATLTNAGATNGIKYIEGPDEYTTDMVQNAVYDRNQKV